VLQATATWEGQRRNIAARVGQREHVVVTLPSGNVLVHIIKGKGHPVDFMRKVTDKRARRPCPHLSRPWRARAGSSSRG
jgi:hypothetical protein